MPKFYDTGNMTQEHLNEIALERNTFAKEIERLNNLITDVKDLIDHELNYHILKYDEETWNLEYYTNGKLDYRKLLIGLLTDINSRLGGKND